MAHPSPQTLPKWLALAMESTSHVRSGLRAIAVRESNRIAARHASEELDLKNADSSVCTVFCYCAFPQFNLITEFRAKITTFFITIRSQPASRICI